MSNHKAPEIPASITGWWWNLRAALWLLARLLGGLVRIAGFVAGVRADRVHDDIVERRARRIGRK